jgi:HAD superfamily hydrolase (TIGR01509 family)
MSIFTGKRALLLDFDGTLGDTFSLHETAFKTVLAPYGVAFDYQQYTGRATEDVFAHLLANSGLSLPAEEVANLVEQKRQAANDLYATHLRPIKGALAFVQKAFSLGYDLYVGSSGSRRNILAGIDGLGLQPYIRAVVTANDVTNGKPHPEIFLTLLGAAGVSAAEALVVEDAPSGIEAALAAGVEVVCVDSELDRKPYQVNPSVHFATFAELLEVLIPPAR